MDLYHMGLLFKTTKAEKGPLGKLTPSKHVKMTQCGPYIGPLRRISVKSLNVYARFMQGFSF